MLNALSKAFSKPTDLSEIKTYDELILNKHFIEFNFGLCRYLQILLKDNIRSIYVKLDENFYKFFNIYIYYLKAYKIVNITIKKDYFDRYLNNNIYKHFLLLFINYIEVDYKENLEHLIESIPDFYNKENFITFYCFQTAISQKNSINIVLFEFKQFIFDDIKNFLIKNDNNSVVYDPLIGHSQPIRKHGGKEYTLMELKQLALKHNIKTTKIVNISINELQEKLRDKNIIINKKIKLEDFKRILKENNIKITKKVNLTKQELIKKLKK